MHRTPNTRLAVILGISRRSLHYERKQPAKDAALKARIEAARRTVDPAYVYRRLALALVLGEDRMRRVLTKFQLKPYCKCG